MSNTESIIVAIADRECNRIARKVIRRLQSMKDSLQTGDDSPLKSTWDEVCVQVQGQESSMWELYIELVETIVLGFVEKLDSDTKDAIWLQTSEAEDWEAEGDDSLVPSSEEEITQHVLHRYVMSAAADWTNARIEKFKEREFD